MSSVDRVLIVVDDVVVAVVVIVKKIRMTMAKLVLL